MTEPKFTLGPWKTNFEDYTKPYVEIINEDNIVITQIPDGEIIVGDKTMLGLENIEANINLIAAAPDMYKVLEKVCTVCEDRVQCGIEHGYEHCKFTNVLRKARGEE